VAWVGSKGEMECGMIFKHVPPHSCFRPQGFASACEDQGTARGTAENDFALVDLVYAQWHFHIPSYTLGSWWTDMYIENPPAEGTWIVRGLSQTFVLITSSEHLYPSHLVKTRFACPDR
jgi:hypothetical protein